MINSQQKRGSIKKLVLVLALVTLLIIAAGYKVYQVQTKNIKNQIHNELYVIAELKTEQLKNWRKERLGEATFVMESPFLAQNIGQYLNTSTPGLEKNVSRWLAAFGKNHRYESVLLVDSKANVRLSSASVKETLEPYSKSLVEKAISSKEIVFSDFFQSSADNSIRIELLVPVLIPRENDTVPVGAIIMRINPNQFLYPYIQSWPVDTKSAESLLIALSGDEVVYLNELRHAKDTALSLKFPVGSENLPASAAVRGFKGVMEGVDYRGVPVLAAVGPVPDSPWFLVAKVDREEVYAPIRQRAAFTTLTVALMLLALGSSAGFYWRRQAAQFYLEQYNAQVERSKERQQAEEALRRSKEELRKEKEQLSVTLNSIGDAVIAVDTSDSVTLINPVAQTLTGWKKEEALGRPLDEIFNIINEYTRDPVDNPVQKVYKYGEIVGLANHTALIAKDGRESSIADSAAPIRDASGNILGVILVFRDVTDERRHEEAIRNSELALRRITDNMQDMVTQISLDGAFQYVSPSVKGCLGYNAADVLGASALDYVHPDDAKTILAACQKTAHTMGAVRLQCRFKHSLGNYLWFESICSPIIDEATGAVTGIVLGSRDITQHKEAVDSLHESEHRYRLLFNTGHDAIFVFLVTGDRQPGSFIEVNERACQALGYTRQELLALTPFDITPAGKGEVYAEVIERLLTEKHVIFESVHKTLDNSYIPVELNSQLFSFKGQTVVLAVARDITERKRIEEQLKYLATHDSLTNIPNRYFLDENIKRAVGKAKRGIKSALLFMDIDNFKLVNDTHGHVVGDELLIKLVSILKKNLRAGDFMARFGGDEFVILLDNVTESEAGIVAEKLRETVYDGGLCLDQLQLCINLTISIGVVMVDGTHDSNRILTFADTALYSAKEGGRNRVVFTQPDDEISAKLSETNQVVSLIKNALKENSFILYYQPVVNLENGKITHFETLIRLQEENGSLIMPGRFIPVAERFGLMSQIDRWVVRSSIESLRQFPDLKLFVNLSGTSIGDEDLLDVIEKKIADSGLDPARIGFEITETAVVRDLYQAEKWIRHIKSLGCSFALDDFGIGFSSFTYLRMLPVDHLKIDGSFIRNLDRDTSHKAIVEAMNAVAHTLGKNTIAEFVENEATLKILKEMGVDCVQGYYLGRPAPFPQHRLFQG